MLQWKFLVVDFICGIFSDMILFDILFLDASFQETTSVVGMPMLVIETVLLFKQFATFFVLFFATISVSRFSSRSNLKQH